ncbi:hypothetical protein Hamer_G030711, partial [Homarus americanus]
MGLRFSHFFQIVRLRGERVAGRELLQTGLFVWLTGPTTRCFLEVIKTPHKVKHFHSAIGVQCPDCQHLVNIVGVQTITNTSQCKCLYHYKRLPRYKRLL